MKKSIFKWTIVFFSTTFLSLTAFSQDDQFYSVFTTNNRWINPSNTDFADNFLSANLISKYQTNNIGGDMYAGVFDISIKTKNSKNCFGFVSCLDKTNYLQINSFYFNWSHSIIFNASKLNFGLATGIVKQTFYGNELNMILPGGNLPSRSFGSATYDIDFGIQYERKDLSFGISANHLPQPEFAPNLSLLHANYTFYSALNRAFYFQAQYKIPINEVLFLNVLGLLRLQQPQYLIYGGSIAIQPAYTYRYDFYRNNSSTTLFTIGGEIEVVFLIEVSILKLIQLAWSLAI